MEYITKSITSDSFEENDAIPIISEFTAFKNFVMEQLFIIKKSIKLVENPDTDISKNIYVK